jgi:hypothetical protein
MDRAYESIIDVINDRSEKKGYETTMDFYEAVRIAYTESENMWKHFDIPKGINSLNKRSRVVNKDPDNLLVQWVPGGITLTEIPKDNMTN